MIWTELGSKFSSPVALTEPQHHLGGGVLVSGVCRSDSRRKSHPAWPRVPSCPAGAGPGTEEGWRWELAGTLGIQCWLSPPPLGSTPHAVGHQSGVAEASAPVNTATMGSGKLLAAPTVPVLVHTPEGNGGGGDFPSCQALGSVARMT